MHLLGYLLLTVVRVLGFLVNLYTMIVAIAVVISWVRPDPYNPLVSFLRQVTEPSFRLARRLIPRSLTFRIGLDLAPIVVFILLIVIETLVVGSLGEFAGRLLAR